MTSSIGPLLFRSSWPHGLRTAAGVAGLVLLALLLVRAPLAWLFGAWLGLTVALAVLQRPALGLALLAISIPFSTVGEISLGGAAGGPTEAMLSVTLAAWLAQRLSSGRLLLPHPWRRSAQVTAAPLLLPLLLMCGAAAFSLLPATSLQDAAPELLKWIETLLLYIAAVDLLHQTRRAPAQEPTRRLDWTQALVVSLILAGALQATLGLYQFLTQSGPPAFQILGRFLRAYGTFRQPNPFAGYLGLILPLAVSLCWWAAAHLAGAWRRGDAAQRRAALRWALTLVIMTALIAAGAIASWSRGAWLGVGAGVATVVLLRSRRAAVLSIGVGGLIALLLLARGGFSLGAVGGRLAELDAYLGGFDVMTVEVTDDNFAVVERVAHWTAAQRMIERTPWQGVGAGNYAVIYPQVALPRWPDPLGHAHNIYLNTWAETGLPGLVTYLLVWIVAAGRAWRLAHDPAASAFKRAVALGVLGAVVHLSIHNLFDNLLVQRLYLHMALLLALLSQETIGAPATMRPIVRLTTPQETLY